MASPPLASTRTAEPEVQIRLQNGTDPVANNDNQPLMGSSSSLQVQASAGSPYSTDRASSEHSGVPPDPKDDRISPVTGSQENVSPSSTAQTAARPSKFILTLGKQGKCGWTDSYTHEPRQMAEAFEATLLYSLSGS